MIAATRAVLFAVALVVLDVGAASAQSRPAACAAGDYAQALVEGAPTLQLELAKTPEQWARGLMFRERLDWDRGMLFVFRGLSQGGFWMMNTYVPLSIAFIDADGEVINIEHMLPQIGTAAAARPYLYALEASWGWFEHHGVKAGDRILLCHGG